MEEPMALVFARKHTRSRSAVARSAGQGVLWDPTRVGRSFGQAALTFRSGEDALRQRLHELELKRRRAQIKARRAVEGREAAEQTAALPFAS
jgi:hypothetical protein